MRTEPPHPRPTLPTSALGATRDLDHGTNPAAVDADEPDHDEVLDVRAAAQLLHVGRNTVYELVGRNEIPHRRLGKQIRFSRAAIMRWFGSWSSQGAKEGQ